MPASPHFFGDQVRRREILTEIRDGKQADYSRGFSETAATARQPELAGTEYDDGWGAHCYGLRAKTADNDRSFTSWGCAKGLSCQVMSEASRMGMCFVGKPLETGAWRASPRLTVSSLIVFHRVNRTLNAGEETWTTFLSSVAASAA